MPQSPQAFFLPSSRGPLFCLFHAPAASRMRGRVLHFHPFGEELNTCRRVSAQCARALAQQGYAVLQFDLWGCGDSAGEFEQASWQTWVADAQAALRWMDEQLDGDDQRTPLWFWGVRGGALLAAQALDMAEKTAHLLLWQPCGSGKQWLQQMLRTQTASQWLGGKPADTGGGQNAAGHWEDGRSVTIAGYTISAELAQALGGAKLAPPEDRPTAPGQLVWLESSSSGETEFGPAALRLMDLWSSQGWRISSARVRSPPFWHNISSEDAPELLQASLVHMQAAEAVW